MRAGGVVAFELIIYLCGSIEHLFQEICANQGRGTEIGVKISYPFGNFNLFIGAVELLLDALFAEHGFKLLRLAGLARGGVQKRFVLLGHKRL